MILDGRARSCCSRVFSFAQRECCQVGIVREELKSAGRFIVVYVLGAVRNGCLRRRLCVRSSRRRRAEPAMQAPAGWRTGGEVPADLRRLSRGVGCGRRCEMSARESQAAHPSSRTLCVASDGLRAALDLGASATPRASWCGQADGLIFVYSPPTPSPAKCCAVGSRPVDRYCQTVRCRIRAEVPSSARFRGTNELVRGPAHARSASPSGGESAGSNPAGGTY